MATPENRKLIHRIRKIAGLNVTAFQIAERVGVSHQQVRTICDRYGIPYYKKFERAKSVRVKKVKESSKVFCWKDFDYSVY